MFCIHTWCDERRRKMKRRRRHIMQIKGRAAESRAVWLERGIGGVQDGEEEGAGSRRLRPEGPRGATRSSRTHWVASVWQSWKWVPCRRAGSKPSSVDPSCPKATSQGEARIKNPELKGGKWVLKNEWGTVPWLWGEGENGERASEWVSERTRQGNIGMWLTSRPSMCWARWITYVRGLNVGFQLLDLSSQTATVLLQACPLMVQILPKSQSNISNPSKLLQIQSV